MPKGSTVTTKKSAEGFSPPSRRTMSRILETRPSTGVVQDLVNVDLTANSWPGGHVALMTCGDDCPGMNAGIRAVVSVCNHLDCQVTYVKSGFYGLVHGEEYFEHATIASTLDILNAGGTFLKSIKCPEIHTRPARLMAVKNLVQRELSYLIVLGGDEAMSVIKTLWEEWVSLLKELDDKELVPRNLLRKHRHLKVGVVSCSITNNIWGSEICVGTNTALHRIIEVTDSLHTTASSTKLAFVVELMGETCGFLALASSLATTASMVFIPEWPPVGDWKDELVQKVYENVKDEVAAIIVLVASGARDSNGKPIRAIDIKDVLVHRAKLETEITVLGHIQKGGTPSAFDRLLASRLCAETAMALHYRDETDYPFVMGMVGNEVTCLPLVTVVKRNEETIQALNNREFVSVVKSRGKKFQSLLSSYRMLHMLQPSPLLRHNQFDNSVKRIAIIRTGRYSLGTCLVTRAIVGYCASKGVAVIAVSKGFDGLVPPRSVQTITWDTVLSWNSKTAFCFGSSRSLPSDIGIETVATAIEELKLSGLIIIGSFYAFVALYELQQMQAQYRSFAIPMCMLPNTILNNIPGTDITLGCDSALNESVTYCDKMKRMAKSMDTCVIVVETTGHNCGYLTTVTAISAGSDVSYIPAEPFNISTMIQDTEVIKSKIKNYGMKIGLVLHSEKASENYDAEFTYQLFSEQGKDIYQCRLERIGHVQVGVELSPHDRIGSSVQGLLCGEWLINKINDCTLPDGSVHTLDPNSKTVLCETRQISFRPINKLAAETDFDNKLPTYVWWGKLRKLARILSKLPIETYDVEMVDWKNLTDDEFAEYSVTGYDQKKKQASL